MHPNLERMEYRYALYGVETREGGRKQGLGRSTCHVGLVYHFHSLLRWLNRKRWIGPAISRLGRSATGSLLSAFPFKYDILCYPPPWRTQAVVSCSKATRSAIHLPIELRPWLALVRRVHYFLGLEKNIGWINTNLHRVWSIYEEILWTWLW
jgi:hypothetical protein